MPDILWGKGAYRRDNGDFAELKCVNMYPEAAPTIDAGVALLSRPGLRHSYTVGSGPIHDHFSKPGLFNGDTFSISGSTLYRNTAAIGPIDGTGIPRWSSSASEIVVTRGTTAYSYREGDLAAIAFPDSANVMSVTGTIGNMHIFIRRDTQQFYWSEVNDGRTIRALSYASAEIMPDALLDCMAVGDNLFLLGEESVEVHYLDVTNVNAPFPRIIQRTAPKGIIATGAVCLFDNAMHYVGHDGVVYRMGEVPTRISNHALEERIGNSANFRTFTFFYQGHSFLCVRLDGGTWVFDPAGGTDWPELMTHEHGNFIGQCAVNLPTGVQFGSDVDGKIYEFGDDWTDDGARLIRQFTGAFQIGGGCVPVDSLDVDCNPGAINASDWPGIEPHMEVRASRDGGKSFGMWRSAQMGQQGKRRMLPRWRRFGNFDAPGAVFDFRLLDPCPLRVSGIRINEPTGGRQRI